MMMMMMMPALKAAMEKGDIAYLRYTQRNQRAVLFLKRYNGFVAPAAPYRVHNCTVKKWYIVVPSLFVPLRSIYVPCETTLYLPVCTPKTISVHLDGTNVPF